ncbi:amino acid adenylation domain-containing protein [Cyanobacterium stanieri LEGE 03274]|uniref:Amino acid adenylation domain-containing protein n=1 Tax=Cyanobacterium stanieri LEGE 03274 TaxID=1828756 RepID=A0ABR9V384_9CHRO|nr:amino acid adenylation domain-containing protein [Cyanobacterium stanieri]MBE9222347.1 amino acid adenylation domain-containing protein [Cyanobacterium stanieri LEGE 03274]
MTVNQRIQDFFQESVRQYPQKIALLTDDEQLTYEQLNIKSNQLAHYLRSLGIGSQEDMLVGLCLERKAHLIISLWAILKAGAGYVPLDPNYPQDRLRFMVEDSGLSVIITQSAFTHLFSGDGVHLVNGDEDDFSSFSGQNPFPKSLGHNLAYVIYTSGSTGVPKGVEIEHRNTVAFIGWATSFFSREELAGVLASTSVCFDLSVFEIFVPLSVGGAVILVDNILHLPESPHRHQVTLIDTVPSAIASLTKIKGIPDSVKTVNLAGEALTNNIVQEVYKQDNVEKVYNLYGPSEDTTYSTVALIPKGFDDVPPIGNPISESQAYLLDDNLEPVEKGIIGEIYLAGAGITRGYRHRPDLTAERYLPNPFDAQPSRMYKTGDLGVYLNDGQLKFIGRQDQLVKFRGFRVELGEIEATLTQYPLVDRSAVILHHFADDDQRLIAYLTLKNHQDTSQILKDIRQYLGEKLPPHEVPSGFMVLDKLPETLNGKINRRALPTPERHLLWDNSPHRSYVAPRDAMEQELAQIWESVLKITPVGIEDDFFELGGNSLSAIALIHDINTAFKTTISLNIFLENSTISCLSNNIKQNHHPSSPTPHNTLHTDIILEQNIQPPIPFNPNAPQQNVLLTGATGLLGSYLLADLLQNTNYHIYCLVRAKDTSQALQRIQTKLTQKQLWQTPWTSRITPLIGDLGKPFLGLSSQQIEHLNQHIDLIYHCGAWVNIVYPYSSMRAANIDSTREIIKIACEHHSKPIFYISTTDVFSSHQIRKITLHQQPDGDELCGGYAQTKYAAEELLQQAQQRGLPVTIFRPTNIIERFPSNPDLVTEFIPRMFQGCLQLKLFPQINAIVNLVPVDYVSRVIVHLSQNQTYLNQTFNIVNPNPSHFSDILQWLKEHHYPFSIVPHATWAKQLEETVKKGTSNPLAPFVSLLHIENFLQRSLGSFEFEYNQILQQISPQISCLAVDKELLDTYLSHYIFPEESP